MMAHIAFHEGLLLLRERRVVYLLLAVALLVLLSFGAAAYDGWENNRDNAAIAERERARWLNQGEKDPHSAAHYSIYAFKPVPTLAALDRGIEPYVGRTVWLEAHKQNDLLDRPKGEATELQRAGLVNPAALLITLGPLLAFTLAFVCLAREREQGILRLTLGAARAPFYVVLLKAGVTWIALLLALVLPVVLGSAALAVVNGSADADLAARLIGWTLSIAVYLAVWVFAGFSIAMLWRDARGAMAVMFGAWALLIIAMPRALSSAIDRLEPLPSTQSIRQDIDEQAPVYWGPELSRKRLEGFLQQYQVGRKEDLPVDERGAQLDAAERHSHEVFDRVLGRFYDRVEAQDESFAGLGFLTPAAAVQSLSQAFAGSDFRHHRQFMTQAERYRRSLVNRMNEEVKRHPLNEGGPRFKAGSELWASIPRFEFQPPQAGIAARTLTLSSTALCVWLGASVLALVFSARRLRP